jgi:predicted O-methyltransferase YrrM
MKTNAKKKTTTKKVVADTDLKVANEVVVEKVLTLDFTKLAEFKPDFERYKKYDLDIGNKYMYLDAGQEHYKFLAFISNAFNGAVFADVGTNHGCSALALGYNKTNKVFSYDIVNNRREKFQDETNITFHIGDAKELVKELKDLDLVFLDACKDGAFEGPFVLDTLIPIFKANKKGILILDDAKEYGSVRELISGLTESGYPVYDLTKYGHYSGTHLVDFSGKLNVVA